MHVGAGGQAGTEVEELRDALPGREPHRAAQERAVGPRDRGDLGELLGDRVRGGPVGGVVVLLLEPVAVHAGDIRLGGGEAGLRGCRQVPARFEGLPQLGDLAGDDRVRAHALVPAARDVPGPAGSHLPPDPVLRKLIPQHGQLVAHRCHLRVSSGLVLPVTWPCTRLRSPGSWHQAREDGGTSVPPRGTTRDVLS